MFCYMCNKEATSDEHVPPRCLFPEGKNLPPGVDCRQELITVPACTVHNSGKSQDDEYLLYLLSMILPINEIAQIQFEKVLRSRKRAPKLMDAMMTNNFPVTVVNKETGDIQNTIAIHADDERLNSVLEHISRALYFHHFKERWQGIVKTHCDFVLDSPDPNGHNLNNQRAELANGADDIFAECGFYGANPDVFKYQVREDGADRLMRLHFYEDRRVSVFFLQS